MLFIIHLCLILLVSFTCSFSEFSCELKLKNGSIFLTFMSISMLFHFWPRLSNCSWLRLTFHHINSIISNFQLLLLHLAEILESSSLQLHNFSGFYLLKPYIRASMIHFQLYMLYTYSLLPLLKLPFESFHENGSQRGNKDWH